MPEKFTRHHLIARSAGGTWHEENLIHLTRHVHDAVHTVFHNDLPIEGLRRYVDVARTTLTPEAYEMINGVLLKVEGIMEVYNPKCYHPEQLAQYLSNK